MKRIVLLLLVSTLILSSGCMELRKKFVRKKKYKKDPVAYVAFKEYPDKPSREIYVDYVLYVQGWVEEALQGLREGGNMKRSKHALKEAVMNMEQIISFFNEQGREKITPLYETLLLVQEEVNRGHCVNEVKKKHMISRLEYVLRQLEADFNYRDAEKWLR